MLKEGFKGDSPIPYPFPQISRFSPPSRLFMEAKRRDAAKLHSGNERGRRELFFKKTDDEI
jgi:hypothetical protein